MASAASGKFVPTEMARISEGKNWGEYEFLGMSKPPERAVLRLKQRLTDHVRKHWPEKVKSLSVRARGAFVYVDAELTGVAESPEYEEEGEQPVCRLRYLGSDDEWEFAFYSWSRGSQGGYEPSYLNNGKPFGTPEQCFDCAAFPWRLPR